MREHIVTSYTEMMAGIQAQVENLGLKLTDFDDLAGFPSGLSGKVFGMLQVKRLGPEKLFDALRAAGLRMRLEVDPDQEAKMRARIADNYNPRQASQSRPRHASSLPSSAVLTRILKPVGRLGGKARWAGKSKAERAAHGKLMVMAREKKRRARKASNAKSKAAAHRAAIEAAKQASECVAP